jgi:hypothetical protein
MLRLLKALIPIRMGGKVTWCVNEHSGVIDLHGLECCKLHFLSPWQQKFEDTKAIIRSVNRRSIDNTITKTKKNNRMHNDLQHITQKINDRATRTPLKPGWTHVLRKGKQFLLQMWHPSFYLCYKPGDKLWMRNYKYCCLYQYCFCM